MIRVIAWSLPLFAVAAWAGSKDDDRYFHAVAAMQPGAVQVGIYPLQRKGGPDPVFDRLQGYLRANVALFPGVQAFDLFTPAYCGGDDTPCLVNAGRMAASDRVIHGEVEKFTDGYAVRMQLVDVKGNLPRREVKRHVHGGAIDLLAGMERATCELLAEGRCEGMLEIQDAPAGAAIFVDGEEAARAPVDGGLALGVGRHTVRVSRGPLSTEERRFTISYRHVTRLAVREMGEGMALVDPEVERGREPEVRPEAPRPKAIEARKVEDPPPPIVAANVPAPPAVPAAAVTPPEGLFTPEVRRWALYGTAGTAAATLVSALVFGARAELIASDLNARYARNELRASDRANYDAVEQSAAAANVLYAVGGVLGAAAATLFALERPWETAGAAGDQP
jgi:hypothetical protein